MKITPDKDGWFIFHTRKGREIRGLYARYPEEKKPSLLMLITFATDPTGQPKCAGREVPVRGRLNHWELEREAEKLERRAEGIERGDPIPPHIEQPDIRKSSVWRDFLRQNPDFIKQHPHYLEDLRPEEESSH